jgi:hypothetical protein
VSNATYQDDNELESSSDESEEGEEIVVTAKRLPQVLYLSSGGSSTMFRTADIQPEFRFPDYSLINDGLNPYEIVGNGLKAIGEAIATLTEAASFALPASEETRLNALANTLKTLGTSLQAGTIDVSTAKSAMSDALSVAFNELGGLAELEEHEGSFFIRGYDCPLAAAVPGHPEVCRLAEALLAELVGVPVHEQCDRSENPRCCFEVGEADDVTRR